MPHFGAGEDEEMPKKPGKVAQHLQCQGGEVGGEDVGRESGDNQRGGEG